MRIIFAVQGPCVPYLFAGGPVDVHHLALTLASEGHDVAVAAALPGLPESVRFRQLPYRFLQAIARKELLIYRDTDNGYETFRVGHWLVPRLLEERIVAWRPDIVVTQGQDSWAFALAAVSQGVPVVLRQIDLWGVEVLAEAVAKDTAVAALLRSPLFSIVSNSAFIAAKAEELLQVSSPVVHPVIRPEDSTCNHIDPRYITFISPVPWKGLTVALEVARLLPHRDFLFVQGWRRSPAERKKLESDLAELPNVALRPNSAGLKDVFASTAVLLAPSQIEEAFGRVIIEAGLNGIPAVASRIGGIPESIGESGVLLPPTDPPQRWADAIDRMLSDPASYARLRTAALANAQRQEFEATTVAERFIKVLSSQLRTIPA